MIGHNGDAGNHQYDIHDFFDAVSAGNFPAVSYLKAPGYQDGHAGYSTPLDDNNFIVQVINFLQTRPEWTSTAWWTSSVSHEQQASDIPLPEGLAKVLNAPWSEGDVNLLRDALYQHAFTRDLSDSPSGGRGISASELRQLLSSANRSRDRWESGWRIERIEATGSVVAVRGAQSRTAGPGDYALTFTEDLPPQPGMAATLRFAGESLTLQAEVYYAFGEAIPGHGDEVRPLRIYFSAPEEVLAEL